MSFHLKRIIRLANKEEKAMICCRYIGGLFILSGHDITPKMAVMGEGWILQLNTWDKVIKKDFQKSMSFDQDHSI